MIFSVDPVGRNRKLFQVFIHISRGERMINNVEYNGIVTM